MIKFGDVFIFNEEEYIFLARTANVIYSAKILEIEKTKEIEREADRVSRNHKEQHKLKDNILYCYVVLTTKEFKDQAAHCGMAGRQPGIEIESLETVVICKEDLKAIKEEIIKGPVNEELKKRVKDIDI